MRIRTSLAGLALLLAAAGCTGHEWAKYSSHKGDVSVVKKNVSPKDVLTIIGQPARINYGDGVGAGWEEWVYPTGSIFFYRMRVRMVESRPLDAPAPKTFADGDEDLWKYNDKNKTRPQELVHTMEGFRALD